MQLLPVLQALSTQHEYLELLRNPAHPQVSACHLEKCEAILSNIESALEEIVRTPLPRSANEIKLCITSVLRSIALMERNIAAHESDTALPDTLRLRIAEAGLLALRFHLQCLIEQLPMAAEDTNEWMN